LPAIIVPDLRFMRPLFTGTLKVCQGRDAQSHENTEILLLIILHRPTPVREHNRVVMQPEAELFGKRDPGQALSYQMAIRAKPLSILENKTMWTKPQYTEMRFGFEVTMYVAAR